MLKSVAIVSLLDTLVQDSENSTINNNNNNSSNANAKSLPKTLAATFLSSQDGSPLLSSLSLQEPLRLKFDSQDAVYLEFLDQFTSIDLTKIKNKASQLTILQPSPVPDGTVTFLENNNNYNNINKQQNYGAIQKPQLGSFDYVSRSSLQQHQDQHQHLSLRLNDSAAYAAKSGTDTTNEGEGEEGTISNPFDNNNSGHQRQGSARAAASPDGVTDSHYALGLLSHYAFSCYQTFKNDYLHYKSSIEGINIRNRTNYLNLLQNDDELKWFNLQLDKKSIFLHLVTSKTGEEFFLLLVTQEKYPKGLAKLKLGKFEKYIKSAGF